MHYLTIILVCSALGFSIGYIGSALRRVAPVVLVAIGALAGLLFALWFNDADAVPVDVEAFAQPAPLVIYRDCRQLTDREAAARDAYRWGEVLAGRELPKDRPLPPGCILPPPTQKATVSKPSTDYHTRPPLFKGLQG